MTARASGQSKPIRAARRDILAARNSAGRASATPSSTLCRTAGRLALGRLVRLPGLVLRRDRGDLGVAEDMRMAPHHLVGDRRGDVVEGEMPGFLGHAGVEHDLQQQIAQFVLQRRHVVALDRIGDLVGLLDRVGRDRREILLAVPRAAALRVAQPRHDRQQTVDRAGRHAADIAWSRNPRSGTPSPSFVSTI